MEFFTLKLTVEFSFAEKRLVHAVPLIITFFIICIIIYYYI